MKKDEYIARYGEAAYEQLKLRNRKQYEEHREHRKELMKKWNQEHREQCNQSDKKWKAKHKKQYNQYSKKWSQDHRIKGHTPYCKKNYELIENYELAKADNFDPKKWHLHHRLENYWSKSTLKRKGLYYDINPEVLIWLPAEEHRKDINCKNSKWHKRSLEK